MHLLKLGQLYNGKDLPKNQKIELASKIDVSYCIPSDSFLNLQKKSYAGYNCLHIAALKQDNDLICQLLKRGADFFKQGTQDFRTPVHVAVNAKVNNKGKQIWEISGKLQECQVVNTLLLAHVVSNNTVNPKSKSGISHFHIASMFNCVEAVKFFLNNGESINQVSNSDSHWPSYTPLHFAIRYSSVKVAEILLCHGADLLATDTEDITPLHILCNRILDVADYMNMGQRTICTPYEEELTRLETIARILIKLESTNVLNILDETGLTIFHVACTIRDSTTAARFLNDNIDLNVALKTNSKFWPGWTPLHFAACSCAETVKIFLRKGADITIKNANDETALDMCLKRFSPRTVHSILSTIEDFRGILFSDLITNLLDTIIAMNDIIDFDYYLKSLKKIDIFINSTSPVLAGYSILHLALSMNARKKCWDDFLRETDALDNVNSLAKIYNCSNQENRIYSDRIRACLEYRCSVAMKNYNGLTPIHLAFKTHIRSDVLDKWLYNCKEDAVGLENLTHLHIACAVGNQKAVKNLLDTGANVNAVVKKSFQWYEKSEASPTNEKFRLLTVNANSTPLHIAVRFEHADIVQILLDNKADLYTVDSEGLTAIHLSIAHISNKIAKMIFNRSRDLIEMISKEGLSHLHVAAFAGDLKAIKKLIAYGTHVSKSIDDKVPDFVSRFAGKTPLQIAMQMAGIDVSQAIQALIESSAGIYANDTLQSLMDDNRIECDQYLIDRIKLCKNARAPINSSGLTLLHVACSRVDVDWALELLNRGANVNARIRSDDNYKGNWKGYTPLHVLITRKNRNTDYVINLEIIKLGELLLKSGTDVTIDSENGTVLHMIYHGRGKKIVRNFRVRPQPANQELAEEHILPDEQPEPPRQRAVPQIFQIPLWRDQPEGRQDQFFGNERILGYIQTRNNYDTMLDKDGGRIWHDLFALSILSSEVTCIINPICADGFSHFHFFCMADKQEEVKKFLDNGIDIDHSTNSFNNSFAGCNALHFAIKYQAFNVAKLLIERGANVNFENVDGNTPLHLLLSQNLIGSQRDLIHLFKRHGANFNAKNLHGETPADILMTKKFFKVEELRLLLANGSTIIFNRSKALPGPVALIMLNTLRNKRIEMVNTFIKACDWKAAVKSGYNPIQEIVKTVELVNAFHSTDDYLNVIIRFLSSNCGIDIDQRDEMGFTPLHNAITMGNTRAVYALIQVGADVNACKIDPNIPIKKHLNTRNTFESKLRIQEHLAFQVFKMQILNLYVSETSESIYRLFRKEVAKKVNRKMSIEEELYKTKSMKFAKNLTARSFLSESWGIVYYSNLPPVHLQTIDSFFKNIDNLLKEFPYLCGLMLVQYKKARARPKLLKPAKKVLAAECKIDLPDLCLECILNYFTNNELEYLIEQTQKSDERPAKRLKIRLN